MSTKYFLCDATWSGAYGDTAWVGILQPNADTSEYGATEQAACGLAAQVILEAAENGACNIAEHATCGAMYHSAGEITTFSIKHTICSALFESNLIS